MSKKESSLSDSIFRGAVWHEYVIYTNSGSVEKIQRFRAQKQAGDEGSRLFLYIRCTLQFALRIVHI